MKRKNKIPGTAKSTRKLIYARGHVVSKPKIRKRKKK